MDQRLHPGPRSQDQGLSGQSETLSRGRFHRIARCAGRRSGAL